MNYVQEQLKIEKEVKVELKLPLVNNTYTADCRKNSRVDSNKHDWDWKKRYWKKKIFVQKHFSSPIYFDGIS